MKLTIKINGRLDQTYNKNSRVSEKDKRKRAREMKKEAFDLATDQINGAGFDTRKLLKPVSVTATRYYTGLSRPLDDDNFRSCLYYYRDGLARALGIGDSAEEMKQWEVPQIKSDREELVIEFEIEEKEEVAEVPINETHKATATRVTDTRGSGNIKPKEFIPSPKPGAAQAASRESRNIDQLLHRQRKLQKELNQVNREIEIYKDTLEELETEVL